MYWVAFDDKSTMETAIKRATAAPQIWAPHDKFQRIQKIPGPAQLLGVELHIMKHARINVAQAAAQGGLTPFLAAVSLPAMTSSKKQCSVSASR
jgi:hypothetical protein